MNGSVRPASPETLSSSPVAFPPSESIRRRLHDLNNVLTGMSGNLELADMMIEDGEYESSRERVRAAREACDRLTGLIAELRAALSEKPSTKREGAHGESDSIEAARSQAVRVLLVDDNPELLAPMAEYLERTGFKVTCANTAEEAVDIVDANREAIDAVVSDVVMPGMSGFELADHIRKDHPGLGIVLMSGHCDQTCRADADGYTFLHKPFGWSRLVKAIGSVVPH